MLLHETNLNKFKRIEIILSSPTTVELNSKSITERNLRNSQLYIHLSNQGVKKSHEKLETTLRWTKMKTQHTTTNGTQLKQLQRETDNFRHLL